jgi:hypothetical protein
LLLLSLLDRLQLIEGLERCLHQLVLSSQELLHLWVVVVGIVNLSVVDLTVVVVVPCVHHLNVFSIRDLSILESNRNPKLYALIFIHLYSKDEVMDKVLKRSHDSNQTLTSIKTKHETQRY